MIHHLELWPWHPWPWLLRQVIDSADLEADHALMDSGMDSLSGGATARSGPDTAR